MLEYFQLISNIWELVPLLSGCRIFFPCLKSNFLLSIVGYENNIMPVIGKSTMLLSTSDRRYFETTSGEHYKDIDREAAKSCRGRPERESKEIRLTNLKLGGMDRDFDATTRRDYVEHDLSKIEHVEIDKKALYASQLAFGDAKTAEYTSVTASAFSPQKGVLMAHLLPALYQLCSWI
jgi:hypothetical protein